jgi:hypothetical protein
MPWLDLSRRWQENEPVDLITNFPGKQEEGEAIVAKFVLPTSAASVNSEGNIRRERCT